MKDAREEEKEEEKEEEREEEKEEEREEGALEHEVRRGRVRIGIRSLINLL